MQGTHRYKVKRKTLRVEKFLDEMRAVVPWSRLCEKIGPHYKKEGGRHPHELELMLRIHFLQLWHNLSDPGVEEAIYDRLSFQKLLGFDCFGGRVPDESSICRFRHLLEEHDLAAEMLGVVNRYLAEQGLILKSGTVVDATLLSAPVSKKNQKKERDPEMSSTKKNNKWHFGAKGHIGVQAEGKPLIHSVSFGTAKEHDKTHMTKLFHGEEKAIFGDSGYTDQKDKRGARFIGLYYAKRANPQNYDVSLILQLAIWYRRQRCSKHTFVLFPKKKKNRKHASIRAKVEHPFQIIKDVWGHRKMRYKGIAKNSACFIRLCTLANLYFSRHQLLAMG